VASSTRNGYIYIYRQGYPPWKRFRDQEESECQSRGGGTPSQGKEQREPESDLEEGAERTSRMRQRRPGARSQGERSREVDATPRGSGDARYTAIIITFPGQRQPSRCHGRAPLPTPRQDAATHAALPVVDPPLPMPTSPAARSRFQEPHLDTANRSAD
jgi:hypothetical protein